MNIPFFLTEDRLNAEFLAAVQRQGLVGLKEHQTVAGMRASIYNAMPIDGVHELISFMAELKSPQCVVRLRPDFPPSFTLY
jgi:phosphoserine aminotransferase